MLSTAYKKYRPIVEIKKFGQPVALKRVRIFPSFAAAFAVAARSASALITMPLQSADRTSSDCGVHGSGIREA